MDRAPFASRFRTVCQQALADARVRARETFPDEMRFRVRFRGTYEGPSSANFPAPPKDEACVFPNDTDPQMAARLSCCTFEEALEALRRDGWVPQDVWIQVSGETDAYSLLSVHCRGGFVREERMLLHQSSGTAPFWSPGTHISPPDPDTGRGSIYHRVDCWTEAELLRAHTHRAQVVELRLHGPVFDDDMLLSMPTFERMSLLTVDLSSLGGAGLATLARQPGLRNFRLSLSQTAMLDVCHLPVLPELKYLSFDNLPDEARGFASLMQRVPGLQHLGLSAAGTLVLDGRLDGVPAIGIVAARMAGEPLPADLESLRLCLSEATEEEVRTLLTPLRTPTFLSLRGTASVGDALVEELVARWPLSTLNVQDTTVSEACEDRLRARYPSMRIC